MTVAGPAGYLLGENAFRWRMIGSVSPRRLFCVLALAILGVFGGAMSAIVLSVGVLAVLAALALAESSLLAGRGHV